MDELKAADAAKKEAEKAKTDTEKKVSMQAPLVTPSPTLPTSPKTFGPGPAPAPVTECDRLAAPPGYSPAGVQGVAFGLLDTTRAVPACREAVAQYPAETRLQAWLGRSLYRAGLYDEARRWNEQAAEKGHPIALTYLGVHYTDGMGLPQDYAKARSLYEKAAALGEPVAMFRLGILYRGGRGVPQDYVKARSWFEKAAEKGNAAAMFELAAMLRAEMGAVRNPQAAARHLLAAARAGSMEARRDLDDEMMSAWPPDIRRAVQELLAASGDYRGRIDGVWNEASRNAARVYYSRRS